MGLNVQAYRRVVPSERGSFSISPEVIDWVESEWPGRTEGVQPGSYNGEYLAGPSVSYGGYNDWRAWLCAAAGLGPVRAFYANPHEGPFAELVNFADNEGVFGPVVSAKLAKDFATHEERIIGGRSKGDPYARLYTRFRKAFEHAADQGCVVFM